MTLRDEEKQLRASALENARLREENERLRAALSWVEDQDPQVVAAARERFGLNEQAALDSILTPFSGRQEQKGV